jgi:porin
MLVATTQTDPNKIENRNSPFSKFENHSRTRFFAPMIAVIAVIVFGSPTKSSSAETSDPGQKTALDELMDKFKPKSTTGASKSERGPASSSSAKPAKVKRAKAAPKDSTPAAAQSAEEHASSETPTDAEAKDPFEDRIFGDWGGFRKSANEKGVELEVIYKSEFTGNFSGGTEKKNFHLQNLDIMTKLDLEKIFGTKGLTLTAYGLGDFGGKPSETFGEVIVSSNIEAANTFKLYELYLTQQLSENLIFQFGTRDLNADFFATESSGIFRNSGFGISTSLAQTAVNGPSIFPTTSLAAIAKYEKPDDTYLTVGVFNAKSGDPNDANGTIINTSTDEGYLYIWELGYKPKVHDKNMQLSIGVWTYSLPQTALEPQKSKYNNSGCYFLADYPISPMTSAFVRFGTASPEINKLENEVQIGVRIENPLFGREKDAFGFGWIRAQASGDYQKQNNSLNSTSLAEVAYDLHVIDGAMLTPSYQHILNPGLIADQEALSIWAVRLKLDF